MLLGLDPEGSLLVVQVVREVNSEVSRAPVELTPAMHSPVGPLVFESLFSDQTSEHIRDGTLAGVGAILLKKFLCAWPCGETNGFD